MSPVMAPEKFYQVGGTLSAKAPSYVQRDADLELLTHAAAGDFCYILTPRQMGKSSLMARTVVELKRKKRIRSVSIELTEMIARDMTAEAFYAGLLNQFIEQLQLPVDLTHWWHAHALLSDVQRFSTFVRDEVLPHIKKRLVVFIDEIDSTLNLDFSDDFFAAIRTFYNHRASNAAFKKLTFVLLGVASPADLIKDRTRTPFNIGYRIELRDFIPEEAGKLAQGISSDAAQADICLRRILYWTAGHPYLTHRVCAALATEKAFQRDVSHVDELVDRLFFADDRWSDANLTYVRDRLVAGHDTPGDLLDLYRRILLGESVLDDERSPLHAALKLSGLVRVAPDAGLRLRNRIYARAFDLAWVRSVRLDRVDQPATKKSEQKTWSAKASALMGRELTRRLSSWEVLAPTIYLSSTYRDLQEYREAVYRTLRQMRHDALAMEDYIATDERPVDKCLADVAACDLYIGIFAWRYGYIPSTDNPKHRSITEMEYREASRLGKPRLIFLLNENAPWPPLSMDAVTGGGDQGARITELRAELTQTHTVSFFTSPDELAKLVSVAVGQWLDSAEEEAQHAQPSLPTHNEADRRRYLSRLYSACQALPLAALGADVGANVDLTLDDVYIALDTTTQKPRPGVDRQQRQNRELARLLHESEEPPLTALEAAAEHDRLVLLGDPGAGKSTFVRQLVAQLAASHLGQADAPPGIPRDMLPLFITLRDVASRLAALELESLPAVQRRETLAMAIGEHATDALRRWEAAGFARDLRDALTTGRCLLVLDGLDEVPYTRRYRVREAVDAVIREYGVQRVIVTCRMRSYEGDAVLPDFAVHTLAPFDEEKIEAFIRAWYNVQKVLGRVDAQQAEAKMANLMQAVQTGALRELAANPMMLTTMAIIHQRDIGLPKERVRLYTLAVEVLLRRWQEAKTGEAELTPRADLAAVLADAPRLRRVLEALAYEAHRSRQGEGAVADLSRPVALALLEQREYLGNVGLASAFLDYVDQRAGLLVGRGGELGSPTAYSFPHRTFQEYLAACHLVGQRRTARAFFTHAAEGDTWRLVAQLGAEELLYNRPRPYEVLDLAYRLCPEANPESLQAQRAIVWSGTMAALAGRETIERDTEGPDGGPAYLKRLIPRLVDSLRSGLTAAERAEAGKALGYLGDPRFRADAWYLPDEPLLGFIEIPAGPFTMGSNDPEDSFLDIEKASPAHPLTLPTYYIARYPVTVAQFRAFVEARGHRPANERCLHGLANHPAVYVSWQDARAYCKWLTEQMQQHPEKTPASLAEFLRQPGACVTLPSEAEWEKAARGPEGFVYPWGNEPDPNCANYADTGIDATSTVGCFPGGASVAYRVEELSGNVWEWTRSVLGDYPYPEGAQERAERELLQSDGTEPRVLRGGSFANFARLCRCALRNYNDAWSVNLYVGFRVVLAALPSSNL